MCVYVSKFVLHMFISHWMQELLVVHEHQCSVSVYVCMLVFSLKTAFHSLAET